MIKVKFNDGKILNYTILNPFKSAVYYVPTSRFVQVESFVRAFRSLKSAARYQARIGCNVMYQDLASGQYFSQGELHNGEYYESYSERVKIDIW